MKSIIRRRSNLILIKPERASATATKLQSRLGQTRGREADEGRLGNIGCEVNTSSAVNPPAHDASNMERLQPVATHEDKAQPLP